MHVCIKDMEIEWIKFRLRNSQFRFFGKLSVQIVVIGRLARGEHKSLRVLSTKAEREDVKDFLKETEKIVSPRERNNIDAVLQVSVRANYELYEEERRENLKEVWKRRRALF